MASILGGPIFIGVPVGCDQGQLDVYISGAVAMPWYRQGKTSMKEWHRQRKECRAPWYSHRHSITYRADW